MPVPCSTVTSEDVPAETGKKSREIPPSFIKPKSLVNSNQMDMDAQVVIAERYYFCNFSVINFLLNFSYPVKLWFLLNLVKFL